MIIILKYEIKIEIYKEQIQKIRQKRKFIATQVCDFHSCCIFMDVCFVRFLCCRGLDVVQTKSLNRRSLNVKDDLDS